MKSKIDVLFKKVKKEFIDGKHGVPKVPTKNEVFKYISTITDLNSFEPISNNDKIEFLDIDKISTNFSDMIDDVDVLFNATEKLSDDVLNQLTNSLKENNGVKRELKRINTRTQDIQDGKLGEEYLVYNYTQNFDSLDDIDLTYSDPINIQSNLFTIQPDAGTLLTLNHYKGKKLEFNVIENYSKVNSYGYVGSTNAGIILNPRDPEHLVYKISTQKPTRLRVATSIQLNDQGTTENINTVELTIDSTLAKGFVRLYYRDKFKWLDVDNKSIQEINSDKIIFNFKNIDCTHIKIEFIKYKPDVIDSNEYIIDIHHVAITKNTTKWQSSIRSKALTFDSYDDESPVIYNVKASLDAEIPNDCNIKLYVAQDRVVTGDFKDINNLIVDKDSPSVYKFDPSGINKVFLSDIISKPDTISGISPFKSLDYIWNEISYSITENDETKIYNGDGLPSIIEFPNIKSNDTILNSLYSKGDQYLFGDTSFEGPWPETGTFFYSGWCNTSNPYWATYLEPLVNSGILASGVDVATLSGIAYDDIQNSIGELHPDILSSNLYSGQWLGYGDTVGYPWGYEINDRILRFGQLRNSVFGWWRPYVDAVTPTGIDPAYQDESLPGKILPSYNTADQSDFYFNGLQFYKIYRFSSDEIITPTIRLYSYQERPVISDSDVYPHIFTWNFKTKSQPEIGILENTFTDNATTFTDYTLSIPTLKDNEQYIKEEPIAEIKIHNTNIVLERSEYNINFGTDGIISNIDLSPLNITRPSLSAVTTTFDIKYKYIVKNRYVSNWVGNVIISPNTTNPQITLNNPNIYIKDSIGNYIESQNKVIDRITVENLDDQSIPIKTIVENNDSFTILFDNVAEDSSNAHFKITIYTASDEETGYSARIINGQHWSPVDNGDEYDTITVSAGIKIVNKLNAIKIVDLPRLIYDTTVGSDTKAAIFNEPNDTKSLVIKAPSRDTFPGYYFDSISKEYKIDSRALLPNSGHYIREGYIIQEASGTFSKNKLTYTTGSSGIPGKVYDLSADPTYNTLDTTWNNGNTMPIYPNTIDEVGFSNYSTFGEPINLESNVTYNGSENLGYLFYNTAENLPAYYSISFKSVKDKNNINNKFLYKLVLTSNDQHSLVPKVKSIKLNMNEEI